MSSKHELQLAVLLENATSLHPFPARMDPSIAFSALEVKQKPMRVLDPMAGSGTTIRAARTCGHYAIGFDVDPLAVLISQTQCSNINPDSLISAARKIVETAREQARNISLAEAYPSNADEETKRYVRFWFDRTNRKQLAALSSAIRLLRTQPDIKRGLWTILSGTIITKKIGVSLAADVSHSRPHKIYDLAPVLAFDAFIQRAQKIASRI